VAAREDAASFERFFEARYARLSKAMYLLTGDHAEAEDLAQEAMARVYERWERVKRMDAPDGYATTIALNLWRRGARRRGKAPEAAEGTDPASAAAARADVARALGRLSADQRAAVVLVAWLGYTAEEAGRVLGIDGSSVRGRIHRARAVIREAMGEGDG
jgi:RNA polymerase sigma factor (sigma-70 family)